MNGNQKLVKYLEDTGILKTPEIISAFEEVDRADFVKLQDKTYAYENSPLSIGYGQTISQPLTVAFMLEKLKPKESDEILVLPIRNSVFRIRKNLQGNVDREEFPGFVFVPLI